MYDGTIRGAIGARLGLAVRLGRACPLQLSSPLLLRRRRRGIPRVVWASRRPRPCRRPARGRAGPAERGGDPRDPAIAAGPAGATAARPSLEPAKPASRRSRSTAVHGPTPPLEPTDVRFPINLATALRLADARPIIVAAAQASVWVAEAQLTRARVLWVPTLNIGFDYIRHDGGGPDFNKGIMTAPSVNFFYGGAGADPERRHDRRHLPAPGRAAEPQRPPLGDPDRQERRPDGDGRWPTSRCTRAGGSTPAPCTASSGVTTWSSGSRSLSRDLVPRVEVDRARNLVADLEQQAVQSRQEWRVQQRRPHPGPAARPPRGGRPAGARPPADHPDRARPRARRPDPDRPDQPPRARRAPGDGPGGHRRCSAARRCARSPPAS